MKTGLVLEGGAMRGMFTCGVLDVLMEHGIDFDGAAGVSAGAAFGGNYRTVTAVNHTSNSVSGSFSATHKTGAYISDPTCTITVTGFKYNGVGTANVVVHGTLNCSGSASGEDIYRATCDSIFCGVYHWTASD